MAHRSHVPRAAFGNGSTTAAENAERLGERRKRDGCSKLHGQSAPKTLNLFFFKKKNKIFFIFEKTSFCLFGRGISFAAREKLWREALQMFDYMQSPKLRERSWSASLRQITLRNMWIQKYIHL